MVKNLISEEQSNHIHQLIAEHNSFVIVTHKNPDGDCIGSALAIKNYLESINKSAKAIVPNDYPESMQWMPGAETVLVAEEEWELTQKTITDADVIFMVDFNTNSRMGDQLQEFVDCLNKPTILIDHHPYPDANVTRMVSETTVSSTCELIFRVFSRMGSTLNKEIATCLLTGMITDTGGFNHNSSTPDFFAIVGELLHLGADKDLIYDRVFHANSESRTRLMGYATSEKMELIKDYNTAIIALNKAELERFNFKPGDTEGFVNIPLSIDGVSKSIFVIEKDDQVKISFRSKGDIAINAFAKKYFNGGGHMNAAGGHSTLPYDEAVKRIKSLLHEV